MEREVLPLVSVVMPAYNKEKYIATAINSVIAQTITDWELIVIDDCSGDGTRDVIAAMAADEPRIRFVCNEVNLGAAATRNKALDMCRGEYVALLDADDVWYPEKLEKQIDLLRESGADLAYCSYSIVDENGDKCCNDFLVPETTDFSEMLVRCVFSCSILLMTKSVAKQYRFSMGYYHEDYVLWLQMLKDGLRAVGVTDVLAEYRYYSESRSSNKLNSALHRWTVYRQYMKLPFVKTMWYMLRYTFAGMRKYSRVMDK